jgi:hypothetical protein
MNDERNAVVDNPVDGSSVDASLRCQVRVTVIPSANSGGGTPLEGQIGT